MWLGCLGAVPSVGAPKGVPGHIRKEKGWEMIDLLDVRHCLSQLQEEHRELRSRWQG